MEKRILLLADINSPHTQRWVVSLINAGFTIGVFSLSKSATGWHHTLEGFQLFDEHGFSAGAFHKPVLSKAGFLTVVPKVKKVIRQFSPGILHAHYASSYGFIGALTGFHPYFISAWGSDVYDFPTRSLLNRKILSYNFRKADDLLSTSMAMKDEMMKCTSKQINVIPFGIDAQRFKPAAESAGNAIIIGTIKRMEETYGISYLIRAFKILCDKYPQQPMKLLLVGDGVQTDMYRQMVHEMGIADKVKFTGLIPHNEVVAYHNMIDIFVAVSLRESFGVAVLEASSCGRPVVVSNVGGLPEVVRNNETGFMVPPADAEATASAIEKLLMDKELRVKMGSAGRKFVMENYLWRSNVETLSAIYNSYLK